MNIDLGVALLVIAVLTVVNASQRLDDFYDTEYEDYYPRVPASTRTTTRVPGTGVTSCPVPRYEDYYPTLFRRDHREFLVSVDHRHIYCDCRFSLTFNHDIKYSHTLLNRLTL